MNVVQGWLADVGKVSFKIFNVRLIVELAEPNFFSESILYIENRKNTHNARMFFGVREISTKNQGFRINCWYRNFDIAQAKTEKHNSVNLVV